MPIRFSRSTCATKNAPEIPGAFQIGQEGSLVGCFFFLGLLGHVGTTVDTVNLQPDGLVKRFLVLFQIVAVTLQLGKVRTWLGEGSHDGMGPEFAQVQGSNKNLSVRVSDVIG